MINTISCFLSLISIVITIYFGIPKKRKRLKYKKKIIKKDITYLSNKDCYTKKLDEAVKRFKDTSKLLHKRLR